MAIKTEAELEAQVTADMPNNGKTKAAKVRDIFQNIIDTLFYWVGSLSTSISNLTTLVNNKADASHTHTASAITSGTFGVERLGTGSPSSANFLRGDGSWQNVPSNGLITENSTGTNLGTASRMQFSNDFTPVFDGVNNRLTLSVNKDLSMSIIEDFIYPHFITATNFNNAGIITTPSGLAVIRSPNYNTFGYSNFDVYAPSQSDFYADVFGAYLRLVDTTTTSIQYQVLCIFSQNHFFAIANKYFEFSEKIRFEQGVVVGNIVYQGGFIPLADLSSGNVSSNGIYFTAESGTFSGRLQAVCARAGVYTRVDTGITPNTTSYYRLKIVWNGTHALFYNGTTLLATITTNVPLAPMTPASRLFKTSTVTAVLYTIYSDYIDLKYERI